MGAGGLLTQIERLTNTDEKAAEAAPDFHLAARPPYSPRSFRYGPPARRQ